LAGKKRSGLQKLLSRFQTMHCLAQHERSDDGRDSDVPSGVDGPIKSHAQNGV
jgi:hypothetical protein